MNGILLPFVPETYETAAIVFSYRAVLAIVRP